MVGRLAEGCTAQLRSAGVGSYICVGGNWIMEIRDSYSDRRPAIHEAVGRASRGGLEATQPFEG